MNTSVFEAEDVKDDEAVTPSAGESKEKGSTPHRGHRKRKRKHLNAIREQMEFYFGDANLSKDRFLMQMINQDPFVPLDMFLTFNKMKKLTASTSEIAKSLSNSQLLELDSDQQKVRRKTSLPKDRNVDHKTLYVESLPPTADHDWVHTMFSRFGPVTYVSLPRYTKSRKIKEFGFIEFEQDSSVEKAVRAFREFNGVLCMDSVDPAELTSVKSFIREQNDEKDVPDEKINKKRKTLDDSSEEPDSKRPKQATEDNDGNTAAETDEQGGTDTEESKRKRLRKKKKKKKSVDLEANPDADFIELRILPKKDWKRLRNKYLNLQREKTAELKRLAWKNSHQESAEGQAKRPAEKPAKKLEKMNMNFYGAGNENDENQSAKFNYRSTDSPVINPAEEKTPLFSYEPGLIVEVGFLEPCVTVKEFKADMKQYETVKYVDIKEGAMQAYLRLDTAQSAADLIRNISCAEYNCKVLSGDAETEYWNKIKLDREAKLNKKVKIPKKRGREKMKKVISKHTRFGDDDAE